jgi:deazaflavin-dependent oxidoreductase (nitroreductase family)
VVNENVEKAVSEIDSGVLPEWIGDHLKQYRDTAGKAGHLWDSTSMGGAGTVPCLLLTAQGRRSGKLLTHPLVYGADGPRYVVVASKGGAETHPQWYFNLLAKPEVTVQVAADVFAASASLAQGSERTRLWELMTSVYPPYNDYQARTTRLIPLFILSRA